MKLTSHIAWSVFALTVGMTGCADEHQSTAASPVEATECPVCSPSTFTITLPLSTPTPTPSVSPTPYPTESPTPLPSPTPFPTVSPTPIPTVSPTPFPTVSPTPFPTASPTPQPTGSPVAMAVRQSTAIGTSIVADDTTPTSAEIYETLLLAATLSAEGKACYNGGGTLSPIGSMQETSTEASLEFECGCSGGAQ